MYVLEQNKNTNHHIRVEWIVQSMHRYECKLEFTSLHVYKLITKIKAGSMRFERSNFVFKLQFQVNFLLIRKRTNCVYAQLSILLPYIYKL
jgi:hypothetical protein